MHTTPIDCPTEPVPSGVLTHTAAIIHMSLRRLRFCPHPHNIIWIFQGPRLSCTAPVRILDLCLCHGKQLSTLWSLSQLTGNIQIGILHMTTLRWISVTGTRAFHADSSSMKAHTYNILADETRAVQSFGLKLNSYGDYRWLEAYFCCSVYLHW